MCGRFPDFYSPQELSKYFTNPAFDDEVWEFPPTWNAAPSQDLPVVVPQEDGPVLVKLMTWGLIPRWTRPGEKPKVTPINARSETVGEKAMFRNLVKSHRLVVPANGFYEWKREGSGKQPYFIHSTDGELMFFAGLYDVAKDADGNPIESFTILTTSANDTMAPLHDRMPVVLNGAGIEDWLDPEIDELGPLEHLLQPAPDDAIEAWPVSKAVNNTRNDDPSLVEPIDEN